MSFTISVLNRCYVATIVTPSTTTVTYTIAYVAVTTPLPAFSTNDTTYCPLTITLTLDGNSVPYGPVTAFDSVSNSISLYSADVLFEGNHTLTLTASNSNRSVS